jgi:AbrB family looped-hinge helix DNA binding protein
MVQAQSKLTSQGQVSVPAAVRRSLGLKPGAVLEWVQEGDRIVVRRAVQHDSAAVHAALFPDGAAPSKSLAELKRGLAKAVRQRHARR